MHNISLYSFEIISSKLSTSSFSIKFKISNNCFKPLNNLPFALFVECVEKTKKLIKEYESQINVFIKYFHIFRQWTNYVRNFGHLSYKFCTVNPYFIIVSLASLSSSVHGTIPGKVFSIPSAR